MYRLGIDVGGTNTDAVIIDRDLNVVAGVKMPTTDDIYTGILSALSEVLKQTDIDRKKIEYAMLGTTQCTNAIVERNKLARVGLIRVAAPAMGAIKPMVDWPDDLKECVAACAIVPGGYEYDGREIAPFDEQAVRSFLESVRGRVESLAVTCVFSPVRHDHETRVRELAREVLGDIPVSLSHEIGSLSFVERENATILNAALYRVTQAFTKGFAEGLKNEGITDAVVYLSQNDGTLMSVEYACKYPILTVACGPTNSIRGASYLSGIEDALVLDLGGTTTDVGVIQNGFPRESSVAVTIGGVRTNFRMPDVISIGLGGGSIVREAPDGTVTVGPDSVGYRITERALCFGGDTMTATDIAVRLKMAEIGEYERVAEIDEGLARRAMDVIREMIEENIDKMKVSAGEIDVVLVGGGSIIVPANLAGARRTLKPEHFGIANAIGSAISKISGTSERLFSYDEIPREEALAIAKKEAAAVAVEAGARPDGIEIIDIEDIPLAYHPKNTSRVKVKACGDLA